MEINHTYRLFIVLPILLLLCSPQSRTQELQAVSFESIKTENIKRVKGLSQNMVNTIIQDREGYMWFGTWDGLNQYDGYDFRIFNKHDGMSNPTINTLLEDEEGIIWVGTQDGLNRFDRSTKSFTVIKNIPGESNSLSDNTINHLYQDRSGYLWISTVQGLNRYDKFNQVYTRTSFNITGVDSIRTNWINKVIQDRNGFLWIATRFGLFKFDDSTKFFTPFFHNPEDKNSISSDQVNEIYEDNYGNLWIGTQDGLNLFLGEHTGFKRFYHSHQDPSSLSNNAVKAIIEDSRGTFWIGTNDKLNIFDREKQEFIHYSHSGKSTSISNDDVNCIFEDDQGSVWIGTYKGVNKVQLGLSKFNYYRRDPDDPHSLSSNVIHSIFKDEEGLIWLSTGKGVNIFDRKNDRYSRLHHMIDPYTDLADVRIRSLHKDHRGNFWFATSSDGLYRYVPSTGMYTSYSASPDNPISLNSNNLLWVTEDHKGYIWVGSTRGLNAFHPDSATIRSWVHKPGDPKSISSDQVWIIYEDKQNKLWFGTDNGLNSYDPVKDEFTSYVSDPDDTKSISSNAVYGIYEDSKGNFWIGTMGGGLNHFDPANEIFTYYDEQDGLPNNVVYITLEDKNGNLWLTTNWGMSKFNPATGEFINYDINDGLQGNEFNGGAWFHAGDGEMFFGGMDGFNSFIPEEIALNEQAPRIVITSFKKLNEAVEREFCDGDTIRLNHDDNFFSIEFSALDYTNPAKNKYAYILDEYDEEWNYRDAGRRRAEYTRVSPGSYTFRVKGSNNDGIWNEAGISLHIIIRPPWWDTLIFRGIFGALIFALLWSFIYWRIRTMKRKHEVEKKVLAIEKELFDIQQKALQLQMNPHFIFNSLNAIQSFVIASNTDKAIHYLSKFSQLMRLILSNSRESSIPVKDELTALKHYIDIERLRFDNKFDYELEIDNNIDQEFMEIPPMIIQPFVENAIIHGLVHSPDQGHIKISLQLQKNFIFCTIEDNGIGRKKAQEIRDASGIIRRSRGMLITRERLEILNKQNKEKFSVQVTDLYNDSNMPGGTRVEINILYFDD
ncbi:MAG: histidine kinase [Bacteroidales bacterium]|nr:histidine kinase [Bacteroidales bacterium]